MELKEFIAETLFEIQQGVEDAIRKTQTHDTAGAINPVFGTEARTSSSNIREVSFDIAVTVNDKSTDKIGGGIKVMGVGIGAKVETNAESSHVSRIQFSIPIIPPVTTVQPSKKNK